ncbi:hypothetical protein HG530_015031 [Fusarium avenaceum]|nr:hypothetical protein HG530_015031 [Fusarium avenaceum]
MHPSSSSGESPPQSKRLARVPRVGYYAFDDGIVRPCKKVAIHRISTSTLTPERNTIGIASEASDVVAYPFNSEALVKQSKVEVLAARNQSCSIW